MRCPDRLEREHGGGDDHHSHEAAHQDLASDASRGPPTLGVTDGLQTLGRRLPRTAGGYVRSRLVEARVGPTGTQERRDDDDAARPEAEIPLDEDDRQDERDGHAHDSVAEALALDLVVEGLSATHDTNVTGSSRTDKRTSANIRTA